MYLARVRPHVQSQTPGGRALCELPMSYICSITLTFISLNPFCGSKSFGDCSGSCLGFFSKPAGRLGDKLFSDQVSAFLSWEEGIWQGGTKGKRGLIWWNDAYHKHTWINFWKEEAGNAQTSCSSHHKRWEGPETGKKYLELWQVSLLWLAVATEEHHRRQKLADAPETAAAAEGRSVRESHGGMLCWGVWRGRHSRMGCVWGQPFLFHLGGILKKRQEQRECFHLRFDSVPARLWEQLLAIFGLG